jgi:hypothetical protein
MKRHRALHAQLEAHFEKLWDINQLEPQHTEHYVVRFYGWGPPNINRNLLSSLLPPNVNASPKES